MKIFFGGVFVDKDVLKNERINYPIKLEYYKTINEDDILKPNKTKFGIQIIKTEYRNKKTLVETNEIKYLTNDDRRVDFLLKTLKENTVTPIALNDIIYDFSKQIL